MKALSFEGTGLEYFKIWIVNVLLTIITLGLYYPWAKVRNNRYFYANSTLEDKNFEYHATGKQLFIAYLIAFVLFIVYTVVGKFFPMASIWFILLLSILIPWIIWRSMRFNMRMTSFSNVKFNFDGKLSQSYLIFIGYPLLFILATAGIIFTMVGTGNHFVNIIGSIALFAIYCFGFAYFSLKKNSYLINSSRYGQSKFKSNLDVKNFLIINLKTLALSFLVLLVSFAIAIGLIYTIAENKEFLIQITSDINNPEIFKNLDYSAIIPMFIIIYFTILFVNFIIMAYYTTRTRAYIFGNMSLDEGIKFSSSLKFVNLAFIIVSNLLIIFFTLGLAIPWAKVRLARYMLENTHVSSPENLKVYLNEKEEKESAVGEQIGDVFDVDVGLAL